MNQFVAAILDDLRRFSPELLDPGTQRSMRLSGDQRGIGTLAGEIERAAALTSLVPALMHERAERADENAAEWRTTPIPAGGSLSRAPWHWERTQGRWLPRTWLVPERSEAADLSAARWVEHLVEVLAARLEARRARIAKHALEAQAFSSSSPWAQLEAEAQAKTLGRVDGALGVLARARLAISSAAGGRVTPSTKPPSPYPRTPPWIALRELSEVILDERRAFQAGLASMLAGHVDIADEPYLYQRWVGVKLLDAFAALGWSAHGDVVGALYLGGSIELLHGEVRITVHVEPRLSERMDHPSGCYCTRGQEVTPDFLLIAPGAGGQEAYVLDASKTSDREVLRGKSRYLELIANVRPRWIAGVPMHHPVRQAWAAAPLERSTCDLGRPDGAHGIVPMNPLPFAPAPITAWIADIDRDARVWSDVAAMQGAARR